MNRRKTQFRGALQGRTAAPAAGPCRHGALKRTPTNATRSALRTLVASAAWLVASLAGAGTINVSALVLGAEEPLPAGPVRMQACGTACRWLSVSGVQMSNGYASWPGAYSTAGWPGLFGPAALLVQPHADSLAVPAAPAGTSYDTLGGTPWQRALVAFSALPSEPASTRRLEVQTFRSGTGAAALSYAVRIDTPAAGPRPTYLSFGVPSIVRNAKLASQVAGPSGSETITTWPARLQGRLAVDVYVDGLPVWSAQSLQLQPQRYQPFSREPIAIDWGSALDGGRATLFLGTLPAGSSRTAVIVMRSDLRVDAPTCHTVNNPLGNDSRRCDTRQQGLNLPSVTEAPWYFHSPDFRVSHSL